MQRSGESIGAWTVDTERMSEENRTPVCERLRDILLYNWRYLLRF